jgi:hypothetical protein
MRLNREDMKKEKRKNYKIIRIKKKPIGKKRRKYVEDGRWDR